MDVFEYLITVLVITMFAWWFAKALYLAYKTGILLIVRPPHIAVRKAQPFLFWFVAFIYVVLIAMCLFMLFLLFVA